MAFPAFGKHIFGKAALRLGVLSMLVFPAAANAGENAHEANYSNVQADYITDCTSNRCAPTDASIWSDEKENWNGVAISVRMGTQPLKTDQEIKDFLSAGFEHFGVKNYRFFFEQNDMPATGISFHVRGGTSDFYRLDDNLRPIVEKFARQANDPNFADSFNVKEVAAVDSDGSLLVASPSQN